jgi:hypothetical protein
VKRIPLTFSDLTNAITSLTGAAKQIAGIDMWRQRQGPGTETLGGIDAEPGEGSALCTQQTRWQS